MPLRSFVYRSNIFDCFVYKIWPVKLSHLQLHEFKKILVFLSGLYNIKSLTSHLLCLYWYLFFNNLCFIFYDACFHMEILWTTHRLYKQHKVCAGCWCYFYYTFLTLQNKTLLYLHERHLGLTSFELNIMIEFIEAPVNLW